MKQKFTILLIYCFINLGLLLQSYSQSIIEYGRLPIKNFFPKDYNGLPQNFSFVQDKRGVIYVGNRSGLLEYDGINWRKNKISNEDQVQSLCTSSSGKVFVGGYNEMGFLNINSSGMIKYNSLGDIIPKDYKNFKTVWNILEFNNKIFFITRDNIFIYFNDSIKILSPQKTVFYTSFKCDNKLFVYEKNGGLFWYNNNNFHLIKKSKQLKEVFYVGKYNNKEYLIGTKKSGFFLLSGFQNNKNTKIIPFRTEVDNFLKKNNGNNGIVVNDSLFSFGTQGGGIVIINKKGKLKYFINKISGLNDETIYCQFLDDHKNLWIGTDNGISKIEINSPISFYNEKNNLLGSIKSVSKLNNKLTAVTNVDAFYMNNYAADKVLFDRSLPENYFHNIGIKEECWVVDTFMNQPNKKLLVVANEHVYDINSHFQKHILTNKIPYSIKQSTKFPKRLFVGLYKGLISYTFNNNKWKEEKQFNDITQTIESILEDKKGNLWLGTANAGIIKVNINYKNSDINDYTVKFYNTENGLTEGPFFPANIADTIMFASATGIFQFNRNEEIFVPQTKLGKNFAIDKRYIHRMIEAPNKNIWFATYIENIDRDEIGIAKSIKGGYFYKSKPFNTISAKGIIFAIFPDENNITWLGGPEGLYKFNGNIHKNYNISYNSLIRKVIIDKDSVLFNGTYYDENKIQSLVQPEELKKILPYKYNSVTFEFAAQNTSAEFPLKFSFFLEGNDKEWSNWSYKTYKDYTNLAEGHYVFRVKAKDIYDLESNPALYEFTILPPWYRTFWAYAGYVILLVVFVYMVVILYTKNLREIIKRKTAEIRKQKDEIEEINEHILDSIKYAKRIQTALLPGDNLRAPLNDHFVLFKPRDIVSGDYYWMAHRDNLSFIVAADCTGHGVPGAFMSMLGMSFLNEIVNKSQIVEPDQILNKLRESVIGALKQTGKSDEAKDGMDLAMYVWNRKTNLIEFSGANNPLYYTRPLTKEELALLEKDDESFLGKGEIHDEKNLLKQLKADKMPIGIYVKKDIPFSKSTLQAAKGYTFYTFSDGFVDQFGGPTGKKFMTKAFKRLLLSIYDKSMEEQHQALDDAIENWKGEKHEQVDDILVIGVRI